MSLPDGSTDAAMTPYHVARSKLFVRERFGKTGLSHFDTSVIEANIEHTRFPFPRTSTISQPVIFLGYYAQRT